MDESRVSYDGPLLRLGFWLSVGVKVWYAGEGFFSGFVSFIHVLYITQALSIISSLKLIYSQVAFHIKYFVLTFSIDVVLPLSNLSKMQQNAWNIVYAGLIQKLSIITGSILGH